MKQCQLQTVSYLLVRCNNTHSFVYTIIFLHLTTLTDQRSVLTLHLLLLNYLAELEFFNIMYGPTFQERAANNFFIPSLRTIANDDTDEIFPPKTERDIPLALRFDNLRRPTLMNL